MWQRKNKNLHRFPAGWRSGSGISLQVFETGGRDAERGPSSGAYRQEAVESVYSGLTTSCPDRIGSMLLEGERSTLTGGRVREIG